MSLKFYKIQTCRWCCMHAALFLCTGKPSKRISAAVNPSAIKPTRKIAPSSSATSATAKVPQHKDLACKISPIVLEQRTTLTSWNAKQISSSTTAQNSISQERTARACCGSDSPLTLTYTCKSVVASKSGWAYTCAFVGCKSFIYLAAFTSHMFMLPVRLCLVLVYPAYLASLIESIRQKSPNNSGRCEAYSVQ